MKKTNLLFIASLFFVTLTFSQSTFPPVSVDQGTFLGETMPLRDFPTITPTEGIPENLKEIPIGGERQVGRMNQYAEPMGGDPIVQTTIPNGQPENILVNFDGTNVAEGQAVPPDPSGAAGPDHYVHAVNLVVKIFDKAGNLITGPTSLGSFLGSGNNHGDPIVMYDQLADRYFVSQFRFNDNGLIIGVSTTNDPTGTYYLYVFPLNSFPDYPHYSVWPNAYYLTANKSGLKTYALEREVMIAGGNDPQIIGFNLPGMVTNPNTVFSSEPANLLGTDYPADVPGYIVYLQDDAWNGISEDHVKVWEIVPDWETTGNSTVSAPQEIVTAPFDSFFFPFGSGDVQQPGTGQRIDNIGGVISYMANYRSFPTHNSFLMNFNVDVDGGPRSGIRWIELRNTGTGPFSLHQEGTWTMNDGENRFMGSMGMDEEGNIGLAYNVGSSATMVELRYTGRVDGDPLGTMTFAETNIVAGGGVQTNTNRFGDYAQMTMDIDNRTFWHTGEYFGSNNFWRTRITAFKFIADKTDDVGAYAFVTPGLAGPYTASETVEVSLYNFGTDPQSNFDIELYLDGNLVATETYTGTIAAGSSDTYQFSATVDMSTPSTVYELEARTILAGDEYADNDEVIRNFEFEILSVDDLAFNDKKLLVIPGENGTYEFRYATDLDFGDLEFQVTNLLGQVIKRGSLTDVAGGYSATADLSSISSGVYIVAVTNGRERASKKFLAQ